MADWSEPSLLSQLIFENPWPVFGVITWAAIITGFISLRRGSQKGLRAAGMILVIGLLLILIAGLVTTTREKLLVLTLELVDSVLPEFNQQRFGDLLSEDVVIHVGLSDDVHTSRDALVGVAKRAVRKYGFTNLNILQLDARRSEKGHGQSLLYIRVDVNEKGKSSDPAMAMIGEMPTLTKWLLDWRREEDGKWRIWQIKWVEFNRQVPDVKLLP